MINKLLGEFTKYFNLCQVYGIIFYDSLPHRFFKKRNKVFEQIINKRSGNYKVQKVTGSSSAPTEIWQVILKAYECILNYKGKTKIDFSEDKQHYRSIYDRSVSI